MYQPNKKILRKNWIYVEVVFQIIILRFSSYNYWKLGGSFGIQFDFNLLLDKIFEEKLGKSWGCLPDSNLRFFIIAVNILSQACAELGPALPQLVSLISRPVEHFWYYPFLCSLCFSKTLLLNIIYLAFTMIFLGPPLVCCKKKSRSNVL